MKPDGNVVDIFDPLEESAPLINDFARHHCLSGENGKAGCKDYHRLWQYLRLLGLTNSLKASISPFLEIFNQLAEGKSSIRILISGSADYALLAYIITASRALEIESDITVLDRCKTPLFANQWYAEKVNAKISTHHGDILEYRNYNAFDLICTHNFIHYFPPEKRHKLMEQWYSLLQASGSVVTMQRIRPVMSQRDDSYDRVKASRFVTKVLSAYDSSELALNINREQIACYASSYVSSYSRFHLRSLEEVKSLFIEAGFELRCLRATRPVIKERMISGPSNPESTRYIIEAVKPFETGA